MKYERITVDPHIMAGKPVIKGTRVTVESILRKLGAGWNIAEILDAHPHLLQEDVFAAASYAADVVANEEIILSEPGNAVSSR